MCLLKAELASESNNAGKSRDRIFLSGEWEMENPETTKKMVTMG
jgi:hypothetical protein